MIMSEPRVILDEYRGVNFWTPHFPLRGDLLLRSTKYYFSDIWDNAYVLAIV